MAVILQLVVEIGRTIMQHIVRDFICEPFGRRVADEVVRFNLRLIYLCELPKIRQRVVPGERKGASKVKYVEFRR